MALDLVNYEQQCAEATMAFWGNRDKARAKQLQAGVVDAGERASVTGGANMDGFTALVVDIVKANGLAHAQIHRQRSFLALPGYFRPTKLWDLLVVHQGQLVAAIELKSHVGPSFSNNFNNRAEEAIGTAHDLWTAYREGAFGGQPAPFVGWVMLVEDAPGSRSPVGDRSAHFPVLSEFQGASYLRRYELLCQKLVREKLYTAAALMASPRSAITTGARESPSEVAGIRMFVSSLAGHVAAVAALTS